MADVKKDDSSSSGGSAFPAPIPNISRGMTLRDWFAGQALAGFASVALDDGEPIMGAADTAKAAYNYADSMLAERAKP